MFGKKKKSKHSWEHYAVAGVDSARDWAAPAFGTAADWAEKMYRKAAPAVEDAWSKTVIFVNDSSAAAGSKMKEYSSRAGAGLAVQYDKLPKSVRKDIDAVVSKSSNAKQDLKKKYVPAASATLGGYADKTAKLIHQANVDPRVEKALVKATGDKKIIKKLRKSSETYAKKAAKELKKQQKSSSRKKGLLVFGIVAASVTAGVALWRASRPVEDPWKKPAPLSPTSQSSHQGTGNQAETNADAKPTEAEVPQPKPAA